jgi:hypothetical protein
MKKRLAELKGQSKFLEVLDRDYYEVSDPQANLLGVRLRPPKNIISKGKALRVGYEEHGLKIDERRVKPPFLLGLRDFCLSYELPVLNPKLRDRRFRELPIYCYFAVSPVETIEQQELLDEIRQPLAKKFEEVPDQWETVPIDAPGGGSVEWKRIGVQGPQLFECPPELRDFDGLFDIYVHSDDTYHVVVAWRAPVVIDDEIDFMWAGEVSLGTLLVEPPPPPLEDAEPSDDSDAADAGKSDASQGDS